MQDQQRLSIPGDDDLDEATRDFVHGKPPLNIVRMLARTGIAPEFYSCVDRIFDPSWFPAEDREVLLFRTCRDNRSDYEVHQHRAYSGLPEDVVDAILGDHPPALTPWQLTLCGMADEMATEAKLSAGSVRELAEHYGDEDMASRAILTMAWFNMLSRFVDSTGVPVESGNDPYSGISGPATTG